MPRCIWCSFRTTEAWEFVQHMSNHRDGNVTPPPEDPEDPPQTDVKNEPGRPESRPGPMDPLGDASESPKSHCTECNFSTTDSWKFVQHMREHEKTNDKEDLPPSTDSDIAMRDQNGNEASSGDSCNHPASDEQPTIEGSSSATSLKHTSSESPDSTEPVTLTMTTPSTSHVSVSNASSPAVQPPPAFTVRPTDSESSKTTMVTIKREVVTPSPPSSPVPDTQPPSIPHLAAMVKCEADLPSTCNRNETPLSDANLIRPEGLYINSNTPWYPNSAAFANPYASFYPNHYPMAFPPEYAINPTMFYPGAPVPSYPYGNFMYPGAVQEPVKDTSPPIVNPVPETPPVTVPPTKKKKKQKKIEEIKPSVCVEDQDPFICHLCDRDISGRDAYETHISYHRKKHHHCPVCKCLYWTSRSVSDHWKRDCSKLATQNEHPKTVKYPCDICEEKLESIYGTQEGLQRPGANVPLGVVIVEKLYFCDVCPQVLSTETRFEKHRDKHKNNTSNQCPKCMFTFGNKNVLVGHMRKVCCKQNDTNAEDQTMDDYTQTPGDALKSNPDNADNAGHEENSHDVTAEIKSDDDLSDGMDNGDTTEEISQSMAVQEEGSENSDVDIKTEVMSDNDVEDNESLENDEVSENEKKFTCHICVPAHPVGRRDHLNRHFTALRRKHYHCRTCEQIFKLSSDCSNHMKTACPNGDLEDSRNMLPPVQKRYPCITCENDLERFYGLGAVGQPEDERAEEPSEMCSDVELFYCEQCPEINTTRVRHENHLDKHQDDGKQFHCADCNQSFSKKSLLYEHLKTTCLRDLWEKRDTLGPGENQALSVFGSVCEVCSKVFPTAMKLESHMDKHKASFECPRCAAVLSRKDHLTMHMRSERCKTLQSQRYNPDEDTELPLVVPLYRCLKCRLIIRSSEAYSSHRCSSVYLVHSVHSFDPLASMEIGTGGGPLQQTAASIKEDLSMATRYVQPPNDTPKQDDPASKFIKQLDLAPMASLSYPDQMKHVIEQAQVGNVGLPDQDAYLYPCPCCDRIFETYSGMLDHYRCHKKFTVCKWCNRDFDERPRMLNHQNNCFLKERSEKALNSKEKLIFPYRGLPCKNCGNFCHTTRGIRLHRCNYSKADHSVTDECDEHKKENIETEVNKPMLLTATDNPMKGNSDPVTPKETLINEASEAQSADTPNEASDDNTEEYVSPRHWPRCDVCRKKFQYKSLLADHIELFQKPSDLTCTLCHKVFDDASAQRKHSKRNHKEGLENASLTCPICQNTYSRFDHFNTHMFDPNSRCKLINKSICCLVCGQDTELLFTDLYYHIRFCDHLPTRKTNKGGKGLPSRRPDDNSQASDQTLTPQPGCDDPAAAAAPKRTRSSSGNGDTLGVTAYDALSSEPYAKIMKCDVDGCEEAFVSQSKLTGHKRRHHTNPYPCEHCHLKYSTKESLKHHMTRHTREHKCRICGKFFSSVYVLRKHSYLHSGERPYECSLCPMKFSAGYDLNAHVKIHNTDSPFLCKPCGLAFPSLRALTYHKNDSKCRTNELFHCDKCEAKFRTHLQLTRHLVGHSNERPYKCRVCQKGFKRLNTLYSHKKTHMTIEKKFLCGQCGASFRERSALTVHTRRHTGEILFTCDRCGKGFATRNTYFQHLRVHDKQFKCPECGRMFSEKGYMNRHLKQTHKK